MRYVSSNSLICAVVAAFIALPAFAEGDGGSSNSTSGNGTTELIAEQKCKEARGKVWDKKHKKCVDAQQGMLDDDSLYETGRHLAMIGRYDEAIGMLKLAANQNDKRVLNYLGYSYRKSGNMELGLKYYHAALDVDPDYVLVREYLGEALIQKGDVPGAKAQLVEIEKRCGVTCEPYKDLHEELAKSGDI